MLKNQINFTPSSFQKGSANTTWNLRAHHVYILIWDYVSIVRRSMPDTRIGQFNLIFRPASAPSSSTPPRRLSRLSLPPKASWPSSRCQLQVDTFAPSRAPNRFRINCTPARFQGATFDVRGWQSRTGYQRVYWLWFLTLFIVFSRVIVFFLRNNCTSNRLSIQQ